MTPTKPTTPPVDTAATAKVIENLKEKYGHCPYEIDIALEAIAIYQAAQPHRPRSEGDASGPNFQVLPDRCPKCGDNLIHNNTGIECGALRCNVGIEKTPFVPSIPTDKASGAVATTAQADGERVEAMREALVAVDQAYCGVGDFEGTGENMAAVIVQVRAALFSPPTTSPSGQPMCQINRESVAPAPEPEARPAESFQKRVEPWMLECFGPEIAADTVERNHRFIEEALELVQSCGASASECHQLVDYVFNRPIGEPHQESGGVMVTHAALCLANGLDMHANGEVELARIWGKVEAIRAKQAAKPKHSPLPQVVADQAKPEGASDPVKATV